MCQSLQSAHNAETADRPGSEEDGCGRASKAAPKRVATLRSIAGGGRRRGRRAGEPLQSAAPVRRTSASTAPNLRASGRTCR